MGRWGDLTRRYSTITSLLGKERVYGVGVDVAYMPRVLQVYSRYGQKFVDKVYHPLEQERLNSLNTESARMHFLASRWAVKEALYKAFGKWRIEFPDIQYTIRTSKVKEEYARKDLPPLVSQTIPTIKLHNKAHALIDHCNIESIHVSVSHDGDYAFAQVVLTQRLN